MRIFQAKRITCIKTYVKFKNKIKLKKKNKKI